MATSGFTASIPTLQRAINVTRARNTLYHVEWHSAARKNPLHPLPETDKIALLLLSKSAICFGGILEDGRTRDGTGNDHSDSASPHQPHAGSFARPKRAQTCRRK